MVRTAQLTAEQDSDASAGRIRTWVTRIGFAKAPTAPPAIVQIDQLGTLEIGRDMQPAVIDPWMSGRHAQVRRDEDGWTLRDHGSSNGTWYWGERVSTSQLADGDVFQTGGTFWRFHSRAIVGDLPTLDAEDPLATLNPELAITTQRLRRVASAKLPVMLLGPTGSGKEVFAKRLHALSGRGGAFVAINTAAIQTNLVASELFGVERGAHSTAERSRTGQVRVADSGTLLLDEIGDMPLEVQAALLRMLQESEIVPVGGDRAIPVDVRVVCATHQDLEAMAAAGTFREDLYARLNGCRLQVPALSERAEDIGLLIGRFMQRYGAADLSFSAAAYRALATYDWPQNVRELEKAIETAVALVEGDRIELRDLPDRIRDHKVDSSRPRAVGTAMEDEYKREIVRLLEVHNGNVSAVARSMGRSRMQIHRWLKRLDLSPESFRSG